MSLPPLIAIVGPTASGKTDLAVKLAKKFDGEIVNADSRQVYKEIDIASAKPPLMRPPHTPLLIKEGTGAVSLYQGVPHHLFDVARPDEEFNVTHFQKHAAKTIEEILNRKRLPFLIGGTGLWISAVVDNLEFPDVPPNQEFRSRHAVGAIHESPLQTDILYQYLITKDPAAASFVNPKNRRRIIRALEVIKATGKPFSSQRVKSPLLFRTLQIGITRPMKELEKRIAARITEQMKDGLEQEVHNLFSKYDPCLPALSSISMREWKDYFAGTQTLPETLHLIYLHNRQYAKRQMTWFKRDKSIQWIQNKEEAMSLISSFLHSSPPLSFS